jgi:hypothetical protein
LVLEVTQIIRRADQGATRPFLCKADDGNMYFVKGRSASNEELIKEWLGAHIAKGFGLPVPPVEILQLPVELVDLYGDEALNDLGITYAFASRQVDYVTELKLEAVNNIRTELQKKIFIFDFWIQNEDRTLTEQGGNPNLLWDDVTSELHVIDHNLIFDTQFDADTFRKSHVFKSSYESVSSDWIERQRFQDMMLKALHYWDEAWDSLPEEWVELCTEMEIFNPKDHLERLTTEANGAIWTRLNK